MTRHISTLSSLFLAFTLCAIYSCSSNSAKHGRNSVNSEKTEQSKKEDTTRIILNHKDITDNKETCKMCNGSGKLDDKQCPECMGHGYIIVYQ